MSYKSPSGQLILLFNLFIFAPTFASADSNLVDRNTVPKQQERGMSSIQDTMPELSTSHECLPKCSGQESCGEFKDIHRCLEVGGLKGCFWSCD